jgi:hypothetical protein
MLVYDDLINVIKYFINDEEMLKEITTKKLKKDGGAVVEINNEDNIYDLLIYTLGMVKNSSLNDINNQEYLI